MDLNLHNVRRLSVDVNATSGAVTIRFNQDMTPKIGVQAVTLRGGEITFYPNNDERIEVRLGDD